MLADLAANAPGRFRELLYGSAAPLTANAAVFRPKLLPKSSTTDETTHKAQNEAGRRGRGIATTDYRAHSGTKAEHVQECHNECF